MRGTAAFPLTVGLLPGDALDVDDELAAVAGLHLALAVLVGSSDDHHLVTLSYGERSDLAEWKISEAATRSQQRKKRRRMPSVQRVCGKYDLESILRITPQSIF